MRAILSAITQLLTFRFRSRASLELEVVALRHQLKVLRRNIRKKKFKTRLSDRFFWILLYKIWPQSIHSMLVVKPKTVVEWHRLGFMRFWRLRSAAHRPWKVTDELRALIYRMDDENPLWGVRRIQGELLKLGFDVTPQCIWKYLRKRRRRPPSPTWRVFLRNHMHETAAIDMFVVFTVTFKFLYAMLVVSHQRRKILHFSVTERPSQDWLSREITRTFSAEPKPKFLIRDRDPLYGQRFRARLREMKIREQAIPRQSPWHNIYVERVIGTIRQECLNHVIIINRHHLRRILSSYVRYYNESRTHRSLNQDCPVSREVQLPSKGKEIISIPQLGGLHHRYERRAS